MIWVSVKGRETICIVTDAIQIKLNCIYIVNISVKGWWGWNCQAGGLEEDKERIYGWSERGHEVSWCERRECRGLEGGRCFAVATPESHSWKEKMKVRWSTSPGFQEWKEYFVAHTLQVWNGIDVSIFNAHCAYIIVECEPCITSWHNNLSF